MKLNCRESREIISRLCNRYIKTSNMARSSDQCSRKSQRIERNGRITSGLVEGLVVAPSQRLGLDLAAITEKQPPSQLQIPGIHFIPLPLTRGAPMLPDQLTALHLIGNRDRQVCHTHAQQAAIKLIL